MKIVLTTICLLVFSTFIFATESNKHDYLVRISPNKSNTAIQSFLKSNTDTAVKNLNFGGWVQITSNNPQFNVNALRSMKGILHVQPNYKIRMLGDFNINNLDPKFDKQWGMKDIGAPNIWRNLSLKSDIIVAVIDTGVDYNHEDLAPNMWKNPGETGLDDQGRDKATNGVDDDGNGYIDDVYGWDFSGKDNDPMDETSTLLEMLFGGGNPGHGTHCAGNVAAKGFNGKGIIGVHPSAKIMAVRFISKKGQGTTADAILSIKYAVDNGAKVLSNSWGSEGEDSDEAENQALRDAVQYAEDHDVLFIAAAGNGHQGVGYDNDTDPKPGYPASYDMETIVSVAAIDVNDNLGKFSNWGKTTVDIAAPGVKVYSTVPSNVYSDTVLDLFGTKVHWDGTSMATPHVAGAAALYWALHPEKNFREVKDALINSAKKVSHLKDKLYSGGKLNVTNLLKY